MMENKKNQIQGYINKRRGQSFENIIEMSCKYYSENGIAEIKKNSEPMRPLSKPNSKGQFMACFTKKSGVDYMGVLAGGQAIVFEAKFTSTGKIQQSVLLEQQAEALERHRILGAQCFVLVSFDFQSFFKIPWEVWRDMKEIYGRKYLLPEDIPEYRVKLTRGMIDFLPEERT